MAIIIFFYFRTDPCDLDQHVGLFLYLYFIAGNPFVVIGLFDLMKFLFTIVSLDNYYQSPSPSVHGGSQNDVELSEYDQCSFISHEENQFDLALRKYETDDNIHNTLNVSQ